MKIGGKMIFLAVAGFLADFVRMYKTTNAIPNAKIEEIIATK
jgi:hypothetical protein